MRLSRLILPTIIAVSLLLIYFNYFAPKQGIGSFNKFSTGSEVNQEINVRVVKSKGFESDISGNITSFYASDQNNVELKVNLHDSTPIEIIDAEVVELLGHLHEDSFTAARVSIIK